MSYLVLARKWRPTTFDEVIGQAHVTQTLKNAIELDRVAHALLFTGSRGIGKTTCARILSKALNCEQGPTVTPCGVCPSCVEISSGRSVDVFEIDGASNNSVEQIREIRESVKFMPAKGRRKVYIIDEVHMLSTSAFNALLKTLEEPPAHVLFVFATTEPHKIPDTIHSRCQRYDFKRIPERTIVNALQNIANAEGLTIEESALFHVAREAQGGMRDSLSLLDQVIAYCGLTITEGQTREVLGIADRAAFGQLVDAILNEDGQSALQLVETQFRRGLDLQKFAAEFVRHLRDLMVVKVCADASDLVDVPPDELSLMARQVTDVAPARLHRILNTMLKGAEDVSRSPFPKLVLEMSLLKLCSQGTTLPLTQVLDGLNRLEGALASMDVQAGSLPSDSTLVGDTSTAPSAIAVTEDKKKASNDLSPSTEPVAQTLKAHTAPVEAPTALVDDPRPEAISPPTMTPASESVTRPEDATPSSNSNAAAEAPAPVSATPPPVSETPPAALETTPANSESTSAETGGFKKRPTEGLDYDDLSAPPVRPLPLDSLRPLKVKARTAGALPPEEVEPFLLDGPPPIPMVAVTEEDSSDADAVVEQANVPPESADEPTGTDDSSAPIEAGNSTPSSPVDNPGEAVSTPVSDGLAPPWEPPPTTEAPSSVGEAAVESVLTVNTEVSPIERFGALLDCVRKEDSFLASELEQSLHLVSIEGGVFTVASSHQQFAQLGENSIDILDRFAREALDPPHQIALERCEDGDARLSTETLFERKNRLEKEHRQARRDAAQTDPGVQNVSQLLNAEIIDVQLSPNDSYTR